ncbi:MAG: tryptophan synthase subunit alpha [Dehalococcoidia bacterium]|jgi:tryptophan synthase alpha chain|nr:tryptophan synthase subunit alpha [Dehalococcoidia bacterium]MDP6783336.1 tryptophan synthase subunit alpha [Dehalococcoidia bacterium]
MSRIPEAFGRRKALIPYVTVGYPRPETALELVPRLEEWGADMVELGIPFSDPLADGATIQEASFMALGQGTTPARCLEVAARLRERVSLPLVFMTYYNPVLSYGLEGFCREAARAGVDGLIIPDLPHEEGVELEAAGERHGVDLVYLLSPNSSAERMQAVGRHSRGFIYLVSLTGVTGARRELPPELESFVGRVRQSATLPLAVGFGISTPEQTARAAEVADGVIVGSRLIQLIREDDGYAAAGEFIRGLRRALG